MASKLQSLGNNILQPKHLNTSSANSNGGNIVDGRAGGIGATKSLAQQIIATPLASSNAFSRDLSVTNTFSLSNNNGVELVGFSGFNEDHVGDINRPTAVAVSSRKGLNTMAKRNARERNRVKQVNQGFQTLRQHIPEDYRVKKMSKVDVLRCALFYIRSLEQKLQLPMLCDQYTTEENGTGNSPVDSYNESSSGLFTRHQLEKMSFEQYISSMSKAATSPELGEEGDSSFYCSDEDDMSKDGVKKPRLSQDQGVLSLTEAGKKQEHMETFFYHHQYEDEPFNKMKPDSQDSVTSLNAIKIEQKSIPQIQQDIRLAMEDITRLETQCMDDENNDENYHSQTEWIDKP